MNRRAIGKALAGGYLLMAAAGLLALGLGVSLVSRLGVDAAEDAPPGGAAPETLAVEADTPTATADAPAEAAAAEPPKWRRPRFEARKDERLPMVERQIERRGVRDEAVLDAMRQVPRHEFVPPKRQGSAYADHPLPIGHGQTISQPYIVALMTEMLGLKPGDRVLEVGTGSAYQAAVLSERTPYVYSIEIIAELADEAAERLERLGYETVRTMQGDGYYGWQKYAPFDAVIVTAAAGHVPPPLVAQLKPGGRMVIPVGGVFETQHLLLVTKDEEGRVRSRSVLPVRFVPMVGRAQRAR